MPEVRKLLKKLSDSAQKVHNEVQLRIKKAGAASDEGRKLYDEQRELEKAEAADEEMAEVMERVNEFEKRKASEDKEKERDAKRPAKPKEPPASASARRGRP
uniref:Uncharacterized protein n=1 Tax=Prymnesium polylepis TaxID=72548 RepID=A0A7S4HD45_9EUKA